MNPRKIIIAVLIAGLLAPGLAAAGTMTLITRGEQVVEGHTVFTVMERVRDGWAVAGLVREFEPRVLWFNDQYLLGDEPRYPCGGWVFATQAGQPPAIGTQNADGSYSRPSMTYVQSYRITDPNDEVWEIDVYRYSTGRAWIVPVLNNHVEDDGVSNCDPLVDEPPAGYLDPGLNECFYNGVCEGWEPGPDSNDACVAAGYRCENPRLYNFVLFGYWMDLDRNDGSGRRNVQDGVKEHGDGGADSGDVNGCEVDTEWHCRDGDDSEGNSHAYNPNLLCPPYNPDDYCQGPLHEHFTARMDLYFSSTWRPNRPANPSYAINDLEGSSAPFYPELTPTAHGFHDSNGDAPPGCPPGWINPGGAPGTC